MVTERGPIKAKQIHPPQVAAGTNVLSHHSIRGRGRWLMEKSTRGQLPRASGSNKVMQVHPPAETATILPTLSMIDLMGGVAGLYTTTAPAHIFKQCPN